MNDQLNTTPEAEALRNSAQQHRQEALDSFDRCDTDGFLSQWAHGICAQRDELAALVAEQGGQSEFPALFDLNGNLVAAKLVRVRSRFHYGTDTMWAVLSTDDPQSKVTAWIKAHPARVSTMERKGYREGTVKAPAKADIVGEKTACAAIVRTDGGFSRNVTIISNGK